MLKNIAFIGSIVKFHGRIPFIAAPFKRGFEFAIPTDIQDLLGVALYGLAMNFIVEKLIHTEL